jgi:endoglucanase
MGPHSLRRNRTRLFAGLAVAACVVGLSSVAGESADAATTPLSISVSGNHFVNGSGKTVRLLGVNRTSAEYGCVDGFGYDDGHFTNADATAIASWGADAVRVPLNEDCWLGLNGQPNSNEGADPALTKNGYRSAVEKYVADLNSHGIYAILDLHWTAPTRGRVRTRTRPTR